MRMELLFLTVITITSGCTLHRRPRRLGYGFRGIASVGKNSFAVKVTPVTEIWLLIVRGNDGDALRSSEGKYGFIHFIDGLDGAFRVCESLFHEFGVTVRPKCQGAPELSRISFGVIDFVNVDRTERFLFTGKERTRGANHVTYTLLLTTHHIAKLSPCAMKPSGDGHQRWSAMTKFLSVALEMIADVVHLRQNEIRRVFHGFSRVVVGVKRNGSSRQAKLRPRIGLDGEQIELRHPGFDKAPTNDSRTRRIENPMT
jgi:hypothetical protein